MRGPTVGHVIIFLVYYTIKLITNLSGSFISAKT